jgi:hypothetical protein
MRILPHRPIARVAVAVAIVAIVVVALVAYAGRDNTHSSQAAQSRADSHSTSTTTANARSSAKPTAGKGATTTTTPPKNGSALVLLPGPPTGQLAHAPVFVISVPHKTRADYAAIPEVGVKAEGKAKTLCDAHHVPFVVGKFVGVVTVYGEFDCSKLA